MGLGLDSDGAKHRDVAFTRGDYVFVLNVGGYIGDSTRSEIEYAAARGKPVRYLEAAAEPEAGLWTTA